MASIMHTLRMKPPKEINGQPVVYIEDYESQIRSFTDSKKTEKLDLPKSDVLLFRLKDKTRLTIRPSGTEPKIKIYGGVSSKNFEEIESGIKECDARLDSYLLALKQATTC